MNCTCWVLLVPTMSFLGVRTFILSWTRIPIVIRYTSGTCPFDLPTYHRASPSSSTGQGEKNETEEWTIGNVCVDRGVRDGRRAGRRLQPEPQRRGLCDGRQPQHVWIHERPHRDLRADVPVQPERRLHVL